MFTFAIARVCLKLGGVINSRPAYIILYERLRIIYCKCQRKISITYSPSHVIFDVRNKFYFLFSHCFAKYWSLLFWNSFLTIERIEVLSYQKWYKNQEFQYCWAEFQMHQICEWDSLKCNFGSIYENIELLLKLFLSVAQVQETLLKSRFPFFSCALESRKTSKVTFSPLVAGELFLFFLENVRLSRRLNNTQQKFIDWTADWSP